MPMTYWGYALLNFARPEPERVYGEIADLLSGRAPQGTERFELVEVDEGVGESLGSGTDLDQR